MKITFVETEARELDNFREALAGHDVQAARRLDLAPDDVEILSIFIRSKIDRAYLEAHPALRLIATRSTGIDHIDLDACRERNIAVSNVPTYGENTVAEHTFALILALSRRLREVMAGPQGSREFSFESTRGFDLKGRTIGVIGAGRIGLHVVRIARAFGMEVLAFDPAPHSFYSEILDFQYVPLDELLSRSHIVSLHSPLLPETRHILNADTLARCRRGALIINTARGALIDTDALLDALEKGHLGGAGLDVLEDERAMSQDPSRIIGEQIVNRLKAGTAAAQFQEHAPERIRELEGLMRNKALLSRPNVIFTPHVAFNSAEAIVRINAVTLENIRSFAAGAAVNVVS